MHETHEVCSGNNWSWTCFWYLMASFNLGKYPEGIRRAVEQRLIRGFEFDDAGAHYIGFPGSPVH